jgi:hypothetical protein
MAGGMAQGEFPEFKPQYCKNKNKNKKTYLQLPTTEKCPLSFHRTRQADQFLTQHCTSCLPMDTLVFIISNTVVKEQQFEDTWV